MQPTIETTVLTALWERPRSNSVPIAPCCCRKGFLLWPGQQLPVPEPKVNSQLHALKLHLPLDGKLRHRLLQQLCLNHSFLVYLLSRQGWRTG